MFPTPILTLRREQCNVRAHDGTRELNSQAALQSSRIVLELEKGKPSESLGRKVTGLTASAKTAGPPSVEVVASGAAHVSLRGEW